MRINCLSCGHTVPLDDAYDDYAGQIKCLACHAIMEIQSEDGKLKSVKLAWGVARPDVQEPCRGQATAEAAAAKI